jgi:hypothetical protein
LEIIKAQEGVKGEGEERFEEGGMREEKGKGQEDTSEGKE